MSLRLPLQSRIVGGVGLRNRQQRKAHARHERRSWRRHLLNSRDSMLILHPDRWMEIIPIVGLRWARQHSVPCSNKGFCPNSNMGDRHA